MKTPKYAPNHLHFIKRQILVTHEVKKNIDPWKVPGYTTFTIILKQGKA